MAKQRPQDKLTILEAVDTLSSLAELDNPPKEEERIDWTDDRQVVQNQERVKQTFRVLNNYLHHIYQKDKEQLKEADMQRGIQAIMILAGEAAQKLDKYTTLFKGAHGGSVSDIKEFQDLQKFYLNKIMRRFQEFLESEAAWEAEWKVSPEVMDAERRGLKDLETVRRDREYELFYIKKEDGSAFFNRSLGRHIYLIGEFDRGIESEAGENPLIKCKLIQDRELQVSAQEILQFAALPIFDFYKEAMRKKERPLVSAINKALMALMLAGNTRNLLQNSLGKNCEAYYSDFHFFLREALQTDDYRHYANKAWEALTPWDRILFQLCQALCCAFFMRVGIKSETISYIHRLIKMGGQESSRELSYEPVAFWNSLFEDDEHIRHLLKLYPSGPLLKALDVFKEEKNREGFDPLSQHNYPIQLFTVSDDSTHVTLLRIPSPTHQVLIKTAESIAEWAGFLRYLKGKNQKHLLINLQDRTSWAEHARCLCLERMPMQPEFAENICVVTLPKRTDFYSQRTDYEDYPTAEAFIQTFKEQIYSVEECGYYFPPTFRTSEFKEFVEAIMKKIHHFFFMDKPTLSLKNRLDFIEIFYHFLILKLIEWVQPDTMSFTCKDGVDTGAAASAGFFGFMRMTSDSKAFSSEDKDRLLWLFFYPSLTIRDRTIEIQCFNRSISYLAHVHTELDTHREAIISAFNAHYSQPLLTSLKIQ